VSDLPKRLRAAQLRGNTHPRELGLLEQAADRLEELEQYSEALAEVATDEVFRAVEVEFNSRMEVIKEKRNAD
jgi:hypothetical protein